MAMSWYAVHTYAGQEDKIKQNIERRVEARGLGDRVGRVVVPTEEETKIRNNKKVIVNRKIFPGYVLVEMEMDDETWHFVSETVGVTGFLGSTHGSTTKPPPLQPAEVQAFVGEIDGVPLTKQPTLYHKGERVNVIGGPFAGNEGRIEEINVKGEKLTVMIPIFGRETRVDLDFSHIERIS